jgi:hypothetical protein
MTATGRLHGPYLKHEPNIPKLQDRIPAQGKVEVFQIECLFV